MLVKVFEVLTRPISTSKGLFKKEEKVKTVNIQQK